MTDTQLLLAAQYGFPVVVALVVYLYQRLLARLPEAQRSAVEGMVQKVVAAVEQGQSLVPGAVKKQYATNMVNTLLAKAGLKASPEQVDTLIEAAVFAINQAKGK